MALAAGTRLGPYEIVAPIGAGGMGEVYKATDTRLNRTVAVKILPAHVSGDDEVKARFDREAQTIAGLNHPNICTLHDVGCEADVDYLVFEFLDGETFAARLARGPMPLAEAITAALDIADALDKAHRQGIVHRDLKPANVMFTKTGPKLLDFGLAKWTDGGGDNLAAMPTRADVTAKGTMLGTLQYMAPEQVEGKEADARTDIFAFGALLYEMVTGKKAFEGKSQATLISAIMSRDPRPISHLVTVSPPALEHLVERCLAKDPDDRWQSAHTLMVQLRWIAYGDARASAAPEPPATRTRRRVAVAAVGGVTLLASALAVPAYLQWQGPPPGEPFTYRAPVRGFQGTDLAMAPDGAGFAFASQPTELAQPALYYRATGALTAIKINGTNDASQPFFSPDSQHVGFLAGNALKRVPAGGGAVQVLGTVGDVKGATWSKQGTMLLGSPQGIVRVSAEGGEPQPVTKVEAPSTGHYWPRFLPDGVHFLYLAWSANQTDRAIFIGRLDSEERTRLVQADSNVAYAPAPGSGPEGYLVYQRDDGVFAHPFNAGTRVLSGEPARIISNVRFRQEDGRGAFDVSETGTLVCYAAARGGGRGRGQESAAGQFGWVTLSGQYVRAVGEPGPWGDMDLSPDGTRVAVTRVDGSGDVWVIDWQRDVLGVPARLTLDPANDYNPVWSHDNKRVAFTSDRKGNADIYVKNANGVGDEEPLLATSQYESIEAWARDGSHIAYLTGNESRPDIWAMPLSGDRKPFPVVVGPFAKNEPQFSYDGRWLAYASDETGAYEVYVTSFPDGKQRLKASVGGGGQPRWSPDGKTLYYRAPAGRAMSVAVTTQPQLAVSSPQMVFTLNFQAFYSNNPTRHQWSISPDGQRALLRVPNLGTTAGGGLPTAPITFSPANAGTGGPATAAPAIVPNQGLTVVLDWPAAIRRGIK